MVQFISVLISLLLLFLLKLLWEDLSIVRGEGITVYAIVAEHASRQVSVGGSMSGSVSDRSGFLTQSYTAVYRFTDPADTAHTVTDPVWSTNQADLPSVGATAKLHYLKGAPERAAPHTFARRFWLYAAVLAFICGLTYAWLNPQ